MYDFFEAPAGRAGARGTSHMDVGAPPPKYHDRARGWGGVTNVVKSGNPHHRQGLATTVSIFRTIGLVPGPSYAAFVLLPPAPSPPSTFPPRIKVLGGELSMLKEYLTS